LPDAQVTHRGFRDWHTGRELIRGRFRGIGAAYGKHVRLGDPVAFLLLIGEILRASSNLLRSVAHARRPLGVGRLIGLASGVWGGLFQPIDASTRRYVELTTDGSPRDPRPSTRLESPNSAAKPAPLRGGWVS
jgi:hypothetical protein